MILVKISMFCNRCKKFISRDLSVILLNITALLARLTQTINLPRRIGIKYCDFCFQERTLLLLYLHALRYIVPLLLYYAKLGYFFLQLTKDEL